MRCSLIADDSSIHSFSILLAAIDTRQSVVEDTAEYDILYLHVQIEILSNKHLNSGSWNTSGTYKSYSSLFWEHFLMSTEAWRC